jgi:hypothetical protein
LKGEKAKWMLKKKEEGNRNGNKQKRELKGDEDKDQIWGDE